MQPASSQEALARVQAAEAALDALMEGQLHEDMDGKAMGARKRASNTPETTEPLSFSAVDLNQSDSEIHKQFPLFPVCLTSAT